MKITLFAALIWAFNTGEEVGNKNWVFAILSIIACVGFVVPLLYQMKSHG